jgi:hypothetical protein
MEIIVIAIQDDPAASIFSVHNHQQWRQAKLLADRAFESTVLGDRNTDIHDDRPLFLPFSLSAHDLAAVHAFPR